MVQYRRARIEGASYFFTVVLEDRSAATLTDHIALLGTAFRSTQANISFAMDAIVVLPDHLHCIWTLPKDDSDYPARWTSVKSKFTHALHKIDLNLSARSGGGFQLWQRRYWEHLLRDEADVAKHMDYIHFNPVKHGWVKRAADWPHSSFHRYVRMGLYPEDWGIAAGATGDFGEP